MQSNMAVLAMSAYLFIIRSVPTGVIMFQRRQLLPQEYPLWEHSRQPLCHLRVTANEKIEDIHGALQVRSSCDGRWSVLVFVCIY
jgi:hypothetical protein